MAVGAGIYFLAVFTTLLSSLLLILLAPVSRRLEGKARNRVETNHSALREARGQELTSEDRTSFTD
jgi:uncharacterized membrane protein YhiD involved in acid resistance